MIFDPSLLKGRETRKRFHLSSRKETKNQISVPPSLIREGGQGVRFLKQRTAHSDSHEK
jgi:hypothetical protein